MNLKDKKIVLASPIKTRSGYGARARDVAHALINAGLDVSLVSLPWGGTPMDALDESSEANQKLKDRIISGVLNERPDIFIHCTIPTEFQAAGAFNIGLTAGIETDLPRPEWVEGCNRMDLILTSSEHSKKVLAGAEVTKQDKRTGQVVEQFRMTTPCEVLFEGIDPKIYTKSQKKNKNIERQFKCIKTDFNFLFVGHWLQGDLGQDRKDVGMLIHTFLNTFKKKTGKRVPGLILKTSHAGFSNVERESLKNKIQIIYELIRNSGYKGKLPPVYMLHGDLTDEEMNALYNHPKVKAMVSFTKGEGFGRPLLEFSTTGKPVIVSNWSGQIDFLNPDHTILLPGTINNVHPSAANEWIIQESKWFTVNYPYAANILDSVYKRYDEMLIRAKGQQKYVNDRFTLKDMENKLVEYLKKSNTILLESGKPLMPKKIKLPKINVKKDEKVEAHV